MDEFRFLLDRFWITKTENKELYYTLKRTLPKYRRFITEQLGWNLVVNESVIKLEKVPPKAMPWMGIQEFRDPMDYSLLCALLLYLSDLDDGQRFLLSSLTEAVETFAKDMLCVDWTRFTHRKSMVRVLRYAESVGLILVYDGNSESFSNNQQQEVLYENTGLSRHFPVHFGRDILHCYSVSDFEAFSWEGEDADRGQKRIHRCYQQLTLMPAMYCSDVNRGDFEYIKNQRPWISKYLGDVIGGELHIHKSSAFFVATEDSRFGLLHPGDTAVSDAVLMLCTQLRQKINEGIYTRESDDTTWLSPVDFRKEVLCCKAQWSNAWGKGLREESDDSFIEKITRYMSDWMLLEQVDGAIRLYPSVGKFIGCYPEDYTQNAKEREYGTVEDVQAGISQLLAL